MNDKKGSKGLSALISEAISKDGPKHRLLEIPANKLRPIQGQDRKSFDPQKLEELASSFRDRIAEGKLPNVEPLLVKPADEAGMYDIEGGERRWRAAELIDYVGPLLCQVTSGEGSTGLSDEMFLSNFARENLNPIELSNAIGARLDAGVWDRKKAMSLTGLEKGRLARILRLREMPKDVQQVCIDGVRTDPAFLLELAKASVEERQRHISKLRDGSFSAVDATLLKSQNAEKKAGANNEGAAVRKPTKLSLKAAHLRAVARESTSIRKALKGECQARFKHSNLDSVTDGEFVEMFASSLDSWAGSTAPAEDA